jgi:small subunit ribosomal protein S1
VLLEEGYVHNASRWHRLTPSTVQPVREKLAPRSRLLIWPDLNPDVTAVLNSLPNEGLIEVVWQDRADRFIGRLVDESDQPALRAHLADAHAAIALSVYTDGRHPLLAAVLTDPDGVLRARWST